jgi:hypothetical protein
MLALHQPPLSVPFFQLEGSFILRVRKFDLSRFMKKYSEESIEVEHVAPLFWALRYNSYFLSLSINKYKLDKEGFLDLSEVPLILPISLSMSI